LTADPSRCCNRLARIEEELAAKDAKDAKKRIGIYKGRVRNLPLWLGRINPPMKLLTAHKILISSSVVFFIFFAYWEYRNYASGDTWAAGRSGLYLFIALGLGIYLKNLKRWYKQL
jgi:hypothetical protein